MLISGIGAGRSRLDADHFYVGVTSDPSWRWRGGKAERGVMRGHCKRFSEMVILAVRPPKSAAPLEKMLIESAKASYGGRCMNKVKDSRGFSKDAVGFLYIVF